MYFWKWLLDRKADRCRTYSQLFLVCLIVGGCQDPDPNTPAGWEGWTSNDDFAGTTEVFSRTQMRLQGLTDIEVVFSCRIEGGEDPVKALSALFTLTSRNPDRTLPPLFSEIWAKFDENAPKALFIAEASVGPDGPLGSVAVSEPAGDLGRMHHTRRMRIRMVLGPRYGDSEIRDLEIPLDAAAIKKVLASCDDDT
jgi:hypothetical protein